MIEVDKRYFHDEVLKLIGITLYRVEKHLTEGRIAIEPGDYDDWVKKYQGRQDLPPYTVELNTFKMTVDNVVGVIMMILDESLKSKH